MPRAHVSNAELVDGFEQSRGGTAAGPTRLGRFVAPRGAQECDPTRLKKGEQPIELPWPNRAATFPNRAWTMGSGVAVTAARSMSPDQCPISSGLLAPDAGTNQRGRHEAERLCSARIRGNVATSRFVTASLVRRSCWLGTWAWIERSGADPISLAPSN